LRNLKSSHDIKDRFFFIMPGDVVNEKSPRDIHYLENLCDIFVQLDYILDLRSSGWLWVWRGDEATPPHPRILPNCVTPDIIGSIVRGV
jgi:hypothetical protein